MNIHLLGGSNTSGQAFINLIKKNIPQINISVFSRDKEKDYVDLDEVSSYNPVNSNEYVLVSFAPIWKLSVFLEKLHKKEFLKFIKIKGLIICSSSSVITKRFSYNNFDKELYSLLKNSEERIMKLFEKYAVPVSIIQPSLIYGNVGKYKDKNLNLIISLMRKIPFILIPSESGTRQPIHAYELAEIVLLRYKMIIRGELKGKEKILLGGDHEITYEIMIKKIQNSLPKFDKGRKCKIILINKKIFVFLISPLNLISPKLFESLLRINADLSGFYKVSELTGNHKLDFPVIEEDYFL